ncbi:metallophosphoesterase [Deinococcus aestuarii]|uniref:metallophosphoesterase n=1 Tax=Deinococcus aestuarii TaxID=2774531 RepID=UPI001C0BE6B4|nr:metallophosphoesterase [Deinococcus aestuarii]
MVWSLENWDGSWLVIPDLHGHGARLRAALDVADRTFPAARLIFLGDLIDDSPRRREARRAATNPGGADDSREVLATVRTLVESGRAEVLLGNHEAMAAAAVLDDDRALMNLWWKVGGREAAASYGWNGKGDAGALAGDLRWLREHGRLWLEVGPPEAQVLFSHATRPGPKRLASGKNRAADLWPSDADDDVVWFPLALPGDPSTRRLHPLPGGFRASVHGHMETPDLHQIPDDEGKAALQIDLHPGKGKLCLLHIGGDGEMSPHSRQV